MRKLNMASFMAVNRRHRRSQPMVDVAASIGERSAMRRVLVLGILGAALMGPAPASAAPLKKSTSASTAVTDISAQSRTRRPRTQLTIRPRGYPYRTFHSPYPLPYDIEYPGPNATRQCVARLVQEARPSGTVIVPRMQCWWVPG
jgi:hypothetical protein